MLLTVSDHKAVVDGHQVEHLAELQRSTLTLGLQGNAWQHRATAWGCSEAHDPNSAQSLVGCGRNSAARGVCAVQQQPNRLS
jgi:hypothetical protein